MNLQNLSNVVTSTANLKLLKIRKHSPAILFVAGTVGIITTVVLACRATMKMTDVLEEHESEVKEIDLNQGDSNANRTEADHKKDINKLKVQTAFKIVKLYAPTVGLGLISIGALTGSHIVLNKRYTGIVTAYTAMHTGFDQYRDRVIQRYGKDVDLELRHGHETLEIVEEGKNGPEIKTIKRVKSGTPSIYAKWFDEGSHNWKNQPELNLFFLKGVQQFCNDTLKVQGFITLNEVYDNLGMKKTSAGSQVGWMRDSKSGDQAIDFGVWDDNEAARDFVNGWNKAILLDFNVDGEIWHLIDTVK